MTVRDADADNGHEADAAVAEYADLAARAVRERLETVLRGHGALDLPSPDALADVLVPSFDDLAAQVALATPDTATNELAVRLGPFWSQTKVAAALAGPGQPPKTRQALNERRRSGTLLGLLTADHKTIYPVAQFHRAHGAIEVKPGVRAMLASLRGQDPWSVALLLRTPAPELGRRTPLDLAGSDDPRVLEQLRDLANRVHREWAA